MRQFLVDSLSRPTVGRYRLRREILGSRKRSSGHEVGLGARVQYRTGYQYMARPKVILPDLVAHVTSASNRCIYNYRKFESNEQFNDFQRLNFSKCDKITISSQKTIIHSLMSRFEVSHRAVENLIWALYGLRADPGTPTIELPSYADRNFLITLEDCTGDDSVRGHAIGSSGPGLMQSIVSVMYKNLVRQAPMHLC